MAHASLAPSTLPALKGIQKVSVRALETAYHVTVRQYVDCTAASVSSASDTTWDEIWLAGSNYGDKLLPCRRSSRLRGRPLQVDVPLVLSGFLLTDSVEIGGIIIKAQRKVRRCTQRSSVSCPVRGVPDSPHSIHLYRAENESSSAACARVAFSNPSVTGNSRQAETEEPFEYALHQEGGTVGSKAICFTDTYTVDDGWGVMVCIQKNWISIRSSIPAETMSILEESTAVSAKDTRQPPHRVGEFVRVRGRLCVKPTESNTGLVFPGDFSRAFLRVTAMCGARHVQDDTKWFAEVYSQLVSMATRASGAEDASPHSPTLIRCNASSLVNRTAQSRY